MPEDMVGGQIEPVRRKLPPIISKKEPLILSEHRYKIELTEEHLQHPFNLTRDGEGNLVDILGNRSELINGKLAEDLSTKGYKYINGLPIIASGGVSRVHDADELVLKAGIFETDDEDLMRRMVALRHIGQAEDIKFFNNHLEGVRHVPPTEALVFPGKIGLLNVIVQEKREGNSLNQTADLSMLAKVQQRELGNLLRLLDKTYRETGRFPDLHGEKPLRGRKVLTLDTRWTPNIIIAENGAFLTDTDDIARRLTEQTLIGWLGCKATSRAISKLQRTIQKGVVSE